jgi:chromosome segregation ATPase
MGDEWVQAKNLVRQQVEIMVNELEELTRRLNNQRASIDVLQKERDAAVARMNDLPSMRMTFDNDQLRRQVRELTEQNEQYREYMRLKDNAKIKVEGQREMWRARYHEAAEDAKTRGTRARDAEAQNVQLRAQNERQALAFEERGKKILEKDEMIRQQSAEIGRLIEVIKLGRKGLEGEQW